MTTPALTFIEQSLHDMEAQLEKMQLIALNKVSQTERHTLVGKQAREERDRIRN